MTKESPILLIGDWHWREDQPTARQDDFWQAQVHVLEFIDETIDKYRITEIYQAGDLFDWWKPSPQLSRFLIKSLPQMKCVCGQHDLPRHSMELYYKSGMGVLEAAEVVEHPSFGFHWDMPPKNTKWEHAIAHIPVYHNENPYKSDKVTSAKALLGKLDYELILTGDNHQQFVVEKDGKTLVNPGSVHCTTAGQLNHEPAVYLWYNGDKRLVRVPIPQDGVELSREHVDAQNAKDERIEAFVERLSDDYEAGLDFENNLESFFQENRVRSGVRDIIWECCEK